MSLRQTSPTRRLSRSKPSQRNPNFSTSLRDAALSGWINPRRGTGAGGGRECRVRCRFLCHGAY
jgi:hypothetical protein